MRVDRLRQRERNVGHPALSVGAERVAEQLEHGLKQLGPRLNEKRPAWRGGGEVLAKALDEPRAFALHGREEG